MLAGFEYPICGVEAVFLQAERGFYFSGVFVADVALAGVELAGEVRGEAGLLFVFF